MERVECPLCGMRTTERVVNEHLDKGCPPKESVSQANSGSFFTKLTPNSKATKSDSKSENVSSTKSSQPQTPQASQEPQTPLKRSGQGEKGDDKVKKKVRLSNVPLAEQVRPQVLDDFIGQEDIVGEYGILRRFIERDSCPSIILWGPSGVGKTTLARIIAATTHSRFVELSAAVHGISDCKKIFEEARNDKKLLNRNTIVFMDEIHRFNRAQQDTFLPHVERGDITLIGATTENPSFKVNGALVSRCRVIVLKKLKKEHVSTIIERAMAIVNENRANDNLGKVNVSKDTMDYLSGLSDGDGRVALNVLEIAINTAPKSEGQEEVEVSLDMVKDTLKRTHMLYDRVGDSHYDTISAFHKSVRGSDPDATLFYLGRMLESGEDPLYLARRMVRIASEDVGLADDSCLPFAVSTYTAVQQIGMPEADCILAHCAVKLATAPKSVKVYKAYNAVKSLLSTEPGAAASVVPIHLRNAPTKLMKQIGYGKDYKYNPDYINGECKQDYMPEGLESIKFLPNEHLGTQRDPELD